MTKSGAMVVIWGLCLSAAAFGQAGTESALTNATSGTSVTGVAPKLGRTLEQTTKTLSDRLQNNVSAPKGQPSQSASSPVSVASPVSNPAASARLQSVTPVSASVDPGNSLAISVEGAKPPCNRTTTQSSQAASTNCRIDVRAPSRDQSTYTPVITLPPSK